MYVRSIFPHASLIALPGGTSHADSLFGDACEDNQIAAYLRDGTRPPRKPGNRADATCAPLPRPVPTSPSVARHSNKHSVDGRRVTQRTTAKALRQTLGR